MFLLLSAFIVGLILFAVWLLLRKRKGTGVFARVDGLDLPSRYIEVGRNGERIHYVQAGTGPHLVFLHGIGASLFVWRFLIPFFTDRYTVTAIDLPGFGRSHKNTRADYGLDAQRTRLLEILDALGIETCALVGSSMGGAIALWMAHADPRRFPRVAVLAPATNPTVIPLRTSRLLGYAPYAHRVVNRHTMRWIYSQVVARRDLVVHETIDAYLEPFLDEGVSARSFLSALRLLGDRRMPECFAGLTSDVLIIGGARDRLVQSRSLLRLQEILPHAKSVIHPTAGHHMMEDDPQWTAEQLLAFL